MAPSDLHVTSNPDGWVQSCISLLPPVSTLTTGLIDKYGVEMTNFTNATWGISYGVCERYCNSTALVPGSTSNFEDISIALTTNFLPWLALAAQLPYENEGPGGTLMSFCMAVGSPALATFSLTLTALNRYSARNKLAALQRRTFDDVSIDYSSFAKVLKPMSDILAETQQLPLRTLDKAWLGSLILLPKNRGWWEKVNTDLKRIRRGRTFSFYAQLGFALITWVFVIAIGFVASLGFSPVGLQIATGSVWLWMLPVIAGWVSAGTLHTGNSVAIDLRSKKVYKEQPDNEGRLARTVQEGILCKSDRAPKTGSESGISTPITPFQDDPQYMIWDLLNVRGDERLEGPMFNYARLLTWCQFSHTVITALATALRNIQRRQPVQRAMPNGASQPSQSLWNPSDLDENLRGNSDQLRAYCFPENSDDKLLEYQSFKATPDHPFVKMIMAAIMALVVQWGTTGGAVIIAYFTPAVGLGCRSSSYILYGILSIASCVFLVASALCSHQAMQRYERDHENRKFMACKIFAFFAVTLRIFGRIIVILNTLWVIGSTLIEDLGVYNNCWCNANYLQLGEKGWVLLFKDAADMRTEALKYWIGGIVLSLGSAVSGFFVLLRICNQ